MELQPRVLVAWVDNDAPSFLDCEIPGGEQFFLALDTLEGDGPNVVVLVPEALPPKASTSGSSARPTRASRKCSIRYGLMVTSACKKAVFKIVVPVGSVGRITW